MMKYDYDTSGKKDGNVSNDDNPITNAKLRENIFNHINACVRSLRDESLN